MEEFLIDWGCDMITSKEEFLIEMKSDSNSFGSMIDVFDVQSSRKYHFNLE